MPDLLNWTGKTISIGGVPDHHRRHHDARCCTSVVGVRCWAKPPGAGTCTPSATTPEAARLAGIRVNRVLLSVYLVAGLIYGITAWILIGRAGARQPQRRSWTPTWRRITAVVIGGTSLFGGRGAIVGTLLGALIVGVFRSGLSLAGVDDQYRVLAIGVLVIVAVSIDQWIRKVKVMT